MNNLSCYIFLFFPDNSFFVVCANKPQGRVLAFFVFLHCIARYYAHVIRAPAHKGGKIHYATILLLSIKTRETPFVNILKLQKSAKKFHFLCVWIQICKNDSFAA